jgi:hypothetical protein
MVLPAAARARAVPAPPARQLSASKRDSSTTRVSSPNRSLFPPCPARRRTPPCSAVASARLKRAFALAAPLPRFGAQTARLPAHACAHPLPSRPAPAPHTLLVLTPLPLCAQQGGPGRSQGAHQPPQKQEGGSCEGVAQGDRGTMCRWQLGFGAHPGAWPSAAGSATQP